jgi:hypothetical protein
MHIKRNPSQNAPLLAALSCLLNSPAKFVPTALGPKHQRILVRPQLSAPVAVCTAEAYALSAQT